ncbi:uncharacterized protein E0L32_003881 [Thyridium curvatum]|uniref:Uncharacterized protein n=1 Tax=Thyridium curvatum TaxID=1093900 RepID=A0A507B9R4_9PEZI|nr:uncharacterized protein E0L32_003881 [Thyridium curvatum]TPX16587.1 hypothetical protein E0L32_003881 [Thyridium curvatum]
MEYVGTRPVPSMNRRHMTADRAWCAETITIKEEEEKKKRHTLNAIECQEPLVTQNSFHTNLPIDDPGDHVDRHNVSLEAELVLQVPDLRVQVLNPLQLGPRVLHPLAAAVTAALARLSLLQQSFRSVFPPPPLPDRLPLGRHRPAPELRLQRHLEARHLVHLAEAPVRAHPARLKRPHLAQHRPDLPLRPLGPLLVLLLLLPFFRSHVPRRKGPHRRPAPPEHKLFKRSTPVEIVRVGQGPRLRRARAARRRGAPPRRGARRETALVPAPREQAQLPQPREVRRRHPPEGRDAPPPHPDRDLVRDLARPLRGTEPARQPPLAALDLPSRVRHPPRVLGGRRGPEVRQRVGQRQRAA